MNDPHLFDAMDDARVARIEQSIDNMAQRYGELTTWRTAHNCVAIDIPISLATAVSQSVGVDHDIALHKLSGLLVPQLDRLTPEMLQTALGDQFIGQRSDYLLLVAMACKEVG